MVDHSISVKAEADVEEAIEDIERLTEAVEELQEACKQFEDSSVQITIESQGERSVTSFGISPEEKLWNALHTPDNL